MSRTASGSAVRHPSGAASRPRASSRASKTDPVYIQMLRLARPTPLNAHNLIRPDLPALPQTQLLLTKQQQKVYVGEEFRACFAVQRNSAVEQAGEHGTFRVEVQSPEGSKQELYGGRFNVSESEPWTAENVAFEVNCSGTWSIAAIAHCDNKSTNVRQIFRFVAASAIAVRTKVSKGSTALRAFVLEAQIENLTETTLVAESCAVAAQSDWQVQACGKDDATLLRPKDVFQYSFILKDGLAPDAGQLSVGWRREPLGAKGWQTTRSIRI